MKTIDTRGERRYSPLIPAMEAICGAARGECLEVVLEDSRAFEDLKEYLAARGTGFREIYDGEVMRLQFTK